MPDEFLLSGLLLATAQKVPAKIALSDGKRDVSFANVDAAASAIAAYLGAMNVDTGDRIVLLMANSIEFAFTFWGATYRGATVVPVNPGTKAEKLRWIMDDCTPALVIVDADLVPVATDAMSGRSVLMVVNGSRPPEDTVTLQEILSEYLGAAEPATSPKLDQNLAAIIYTSGSTGRPKGVMLSHLNMLTAARSVALYLAYSASDRVFCAIPFTFDYGLHQITMTALTGATLIVERSFAQPFFSLHRMVKSGATVLPIVPTMVSLIEPLADRLDLTSIRTVTSTAAALHAGLIDRVERMFPAAQIFSMYGLSECHRCTFLDPAFLRTHRASVGKAIPNTELWVVDDNGIAQRRNAVGELVIRGSTVMKGYWNNPEQTEKKLKPGPLPGELVLHTGDICRLDEDGFLYFVARKDDVLKVRGEKVAPREVEDVLLHHPAVCQAAILGQDDPVSGQKVVAFVELGVGCAATPEALTTWCKDHVEPFMVPAAITVLDSLPRNENGKIDKLALGSLLDCGSLRPVASALIGRSPTAPLDLHDCPANTALKEEIHA